MNKSMFTLHEDYDADQSEVYGVLWGYRYGCTDEELKVLLHNIDNDREKVIEELCKKLNLSTNDSTKEKIKQVVIDFYHETLDNEKEKS